MLSSDFLLSIEENATCTTGSVGICMYLTEIDIMEKLFGIRLKGLVCMNWQLIVKEEGIGCSVTNNVK